MLINNEFSSYNLMIYDHIKKLENTYMKTKITSLRITNQIT